MPIEIAAFESTPNPNAVKCLLTGAALPERSPPLSVSARTREQAASHPLAAALFELGGVTGVLITPAWLTVNKTADADWRTLKPRIKRAVKQWGESDGA